MYILLFKSHANITQLSQKIYTNTAVGGFAF